METEMTTNSPTSRRLAVAGRLAGRRRRQPPLEAALTSGDPDDIPRTAGLLGDLFVQQGQTGAAEHAYRAAIDTDHPYWSSVAQVALAQLLGDRGHGEEAKTLLEDAIASGHPRTASVAQASLSELSTCDKDAALGPSLDAYETLSDPISAHRSQVVGDARTQGPRGPEWDRARARSQAPNEPGVGSATPRPDAARAPGDATVARKARKSALTGLIGLAAAVVAATTVLVSELGAETPVSTAAERQESVVAARHDTGPRTADTGAWLESGTEYTGPTIPNAAEHWIRWLHRNEDRIVRHLGDRIASGQISTEEFEAVAGTRVTNGDWTQDMVDRIVNAARTRTVSQLYQGCQVYSAGTLTTRPGC
jgi:hypothetical protein